MATGNINLELSKDTYELFRATRIIYCNALDCKNNKMNDKIYQDVECKLKSIRIINHGQCLDYEKINANKPTS